VIGRTSVPLDVRATSVRHHETNFGNFVADVYREALQAQVAIVNGGGLRSDTQMPAGEITKRDVLSILPFENALVKLSVTGAHLRRLLENGVSAADREDGRFPQVSGLSFEFDMARPPRSRVVSVLVAGEPLRDEASYTLAVSAYVLKGGDDYDLKGAEILVSPEDGPVEPVVVMEAIRRRGTIAPAVEGRSKQVP
jgi:2',3'-cyclic-nucleotide 2'-phosphodiesterase (5'-nucleotidase family)